MQRKKLFSIILVVLLCGAGFYGFFSGNDPNSKSTAVDYINNGGSVDNVQPPHFTGDLVGSWTAGTNMPAPTRYQGSGALWHSAGYDTLKLICFGGDNNGSGTTDPTTSIFTLTGSGAGTWSTGVPTPLSRFYAAACCVGDTAYFLSGIPTPGTFGTEVTNVDGYSVRGNTYRTVAPLPSARADGKAVSYQDSLMYYIGGYAGATPNANVNVYLYSQRTGTWRTATSLPVARSGFGCAINGDTIVVVCGGTAYSSGLTNTTYKGVISSADHSTITWTLGANYPGASLHRINGGTWGCKGVIMGPGSLSGFTTNTECYVYSPSANTWTAQANCTTPTSAYFAGASKYGTAGQWKFIVASGLVLTAPFSIPQVQIFSDSLCPAPPGAPLCEGFTSATFPPTGWTGTTGAFPWTRNAVSGFGLGSGSAKADFWDASSGEIEDLTTPVFTPTANVFDSLRISEAFQPFGAPDSLIINISNNGGTSYVKLVALGNTQLGTTTGNPSPFTPTASQWGRRAWSLPVGTNRIQFRSKSGFGDNLYIDSLCIQYIPVGIGHNNTGVPNVYSLSQNYPNPFNPSTQIQFGLPKAGIVKLVVYDILGREVKTLVNEFRNAGTYNLSFDASSLSSGVYFYSIKANDFTETKKMLLVK